MHRSESGGARVDARTLARRHFAANSAITTLPLIRAFVRTFCQQLPVAVLDEEQIAQLELAVTEAASNIMRHAYQGRADQPLLVIAEAFPDRVVIEFLHHGKGFDPMQVAPPAFDGSREGGFGVYIIAHSVDEVSYIHDELRGQCVRLVKKRKAFQEGEV
jgi:serine/threonine-protein kinase RsbW